MALNVAKNAVVQIILSVFDMKCILDEEIICTRKIITKDFEERPECLSNSFELTASDCLINKDMR